MGKILVENPDGSETLKEIEEDGSGAQNLERMDGLYDLLLKIFSKWMEMDEKDLKILTLWTLGAYFHNSFQTFPYLFFNAMKASGKSRVLRLLAFLLDGTYTVNMTEAILFRKNDPLMLDEAENLRGKEKANLRELLNIAYKKGGVVERARKNPKTEAFEIDRFCVYRPVAMANISGLDDVLESRCIMLKLERSYNKRITRMVEVFDRDNDIMNFKVAMRTFLSLHTNSNKGVTTVQGRDSNTGFFDFLILYNTLVDLLNNNLTTDKTSITVKSTVKAEKIVERLEKSDLVGRDFELWLPLFLIAEMVGDNILEEAVAYADQHSKERMETDLLQNKDVGFIAFLKEYMESKNPSEFISISNLVSTYIMENPSDKWFTSEWVGWALRRNNLVLGKRRHKGIREVLLDFEKIREKCRKLGIEPGEAKKEEVRQNLGSIEDYIGED